MSEYEGGVKKWYRNPVWVIPAVAAALVIYVAVANSRAPHARIREPLRTHVGYTPILVDAEFWVPADFKGEDPWITATTMDGEVFEGRRGDIVEYQISGSVFQAKAWFIAWRNWSVFPDSLKRKYNQEVLYKPTTSRTKPQHVVWDHGKLTPEVVQFHTGPVFMPKSQGPEDYPDWKFPDLELPVGFPMISTYRRPLPLSRQLWHRNGVGMPDSCGTIEILRGGPLRLYLNYNLSTDIGASVDWERFRLKRGGIRRNQGGYTEKICVWRPQAS